METNDGPKPPAAPPNETTLHEAALTYLARFATTETGLRRVLDRRIDAWARSTHDPDAVAETVAKAKLSAKAVVTKLAGLGLVNDVAFAEARARGLTRAGLSRRAIAARLAAKGVDADTARAALPDDADRELTAALTLARRRRIGPFRPVPASDQAGRQRELAILARAGFAHDIARSALAMDPDEAESRILEARR